MKGIGAEERRRTRQSNVECRSTSCCSSSAEERRRWKKEQSKRDE